ncbi:hypothetical protein [Prescottella equi]|nr:hypothetical protein [Prescottella equi]
MTSSPRYEVAGVTVLVAVMLSFVTVCVAVSRGDGSADAMA